MRKPPGESEIIRRAVVELRITESALDYAKRTMGKFCVEGVNCTAIEDKYLLTVKKAERVREDLKAGNYTSLEMDLAEMIKAREALKIALHAVMRSALHKNVGRIAKVQLSALERLMLRIKTANATNTTEELGRINALREELQRALRENNPQTALEILKELRQEVMRLIRLIRREEQYIHEEPRIPGEKNGKSGKTPGKGNHSNRRGGRG